MSRSEIAPDFAEEVLRDLYVYRKRRPWLAWLLWITLGLVGAHRFYLDRPGTGLLMLFTGGGAGLWWLVDSFLLPAMLREHNREQARREAEGLPPIELAFMPALDPIELGRPPAWIDRWYEASPLRRRVRLGGDLLVLLVCGTVLGGAARYADIWEPIAPVLLLALFASAGAALGRWAGAPVLGTLLRWSHRVRLFYYFNAPGSPPALLVRSITASITAPFRARDRAEVRLYLQLGAFFTMLFLVLEFGAELAAVLGGGGLPDLGTLVEGALREAVTNFVVIFAFATPIGAVISLYVLVTRTHTLPRLLSAFVVGTVLLTLLVACEPGTTAPATDPSHTVSVSPSEAWLLTGDTLRLQVIVRDADGRVVRVPALAERGRPAPPGVPRPLGDPRGRRGDHLRRAAGAATRLRAGRPGVGRGDGPRGAAGDDARPPAGRGHHASPDPAPGRMGPVRERRLDLAALRPGGRRGPRDRRSAHGRGAPPLDRGAPARLRPRPTLRLFEHRVLHPGPGGGAGHWPRLRGVRARRGARDGGSDRDAGGRLAQIGSPPRRGTLSRLGHDRIGVSRARGRALGVRPVLARSPRRPGRMGGVGGRLPALPARGGRTGRSPGPDRPGVGRLDQHQARGVRLRRRHELVQRVQRAAAGRRSLLVARRRPPRNPNPRDPPAGRHIVRDLAEQTGLVARPGELGAGHAPGRPAAGDRGVAGPRPLRVRGLSGGAARGRGPSALVQNRKPTVAVIRARHRADADPVGANVGRHPTPVAGHPIVAVLVEVHAGAERERAREVRFEAESEVLAIIAAQRAAAGELTRVGP